MKRGFLSTILASAVLGLASTGAHAVPVGLSAVTSALQGPIYLQYNNAEQFSATNSIDGNGSAPGTPAEGNWGIVQVSSIVGGTALSPTGSDIQGGGTPIFADQISGGQITGIFYGIQVDPTNPERATGGFMDLYWQTGTSVNVGAELNNSANLAKRTAADQYTGFTTGTLLLHLAFGTGCDGAGTTATVCTAVDPTSSDGTAKSYENVVAGTGLWASKFNTDFFTLDPNNNPMTPRDVRTDSNYSHNGAGAWNVAGTDIVGLRSNDPVRAYALPEPGSLALFGLGLVAVGLFGFLRQHRGTES